MASSCESEVLSLLKQKGLDVAVAEKFKEFENVQSFISFSWDETKLSDRDIRLEDQKKCLTIICELQSSFNTKVFQDSIHGVIELHPLLVKIINTPQFQRLRDIKQLGGVYYVYPGASHNRFEHSIGVCYLAGAFVRSLRKHQPELEIDDCDILCVEIAALCHDMGHGPFSHFYQDLFIPHFHKDSLDKRKWKHEEASMKLMEYMIKVNEGLLEEFNRYGVNWEKERVFIEELIYGRRDKVEFKGRANSKHFFYEIVANMESGIDVDKMDYILRDSFALGITVHFDWKRYVQFSRVITCEDGKRHICLREKEARNVYDLFHARDKLFRCAYQHKTKRSMEFMLLEAMIIANDCIKIPGTKGRDVKMSDAIDDMEAFTNLTDSVLYSIAFYPCDKLKHAREILEKIKKREFYMFIGSSLVLEEDGLPHIEQSALTKCIMDGCKKSESQNCLKEDMIKIDRVKFDYGFGSSSPLEKMYFYEKAFLHKSFPLGKKNVSMFLPSKFEEWEVRVYYKEFNDEARKCVKSGFRQWKRSESSEFPGRNGVTSFP